MGGESNNGQWTLNQAKTTTLVKSDGSSSPAFSMKSKTVLVSRYYFLDFLHKNYVYINRAACAIPDGDSLVIVDGKEVSRYNEDGFVEALPSIPSGGGFQSCARYTNNKNKEVLNNH